MSPFEAFKTYLALRRHFSEEGYDFFRFNGKTNASVASFEKRKDQFQFAKLAKLSSPEDRVLACFSRGVSWIGDMVGTAGDEAHRDWTKKNQSLTYVIGTELRHLDPSFNENFVSSAGRAPLLMRLFYTKRVSIETICVLVETAGVEEYWHRLVPSLDVVFADFEKLVRKYSPFIRYDREAVREKVLYHFTQV